MEYRRFGKLDWKVSALGFGCMRFPRNRQGEIEVAETEQLLGYAIEHGVNYLDTSHEYEGTEEVLGNLLSRGYRDRVKIATKLLPWRVDSAADFDAMLEKQLVLLQTDHIDLYMLHALNCRRWPHVRDLGILQWLEKQLAAGRIRGTGFSFHDEYKVFQEIVDSFDWTVCQIQYNFRDIQYQAGEKGLRYAASRGMAVAVMSPLRGGQLVDPPRQIREIWKQAPQKRSPADWALQWLWSQPEVSVVLSGMSAMDQLAENITSAEASGVGKLSSAEQSLCERAGSVYRGLHPVPCTGCGYCMPCPHGVNIPRNFYRFNEGKVHGGKTLELARRDYDQGELRPNAAHAGACTQCRECESKCPQEIPISEWMPKVDAVLGEGRSYAEVLRQGAG